MPRGALHVGMELAWGVQASWLQAFARRLADDHAVIRRFRDCRGCVHGLVGDEFKVISRQVDDGNRGFRRLRLLYVFGGIARPVVARAFMPSTRRDLAKEKFICILRSETETTVKVSVKIFSRSRAKAKSDTHKTRRRDAVCCVARPPSRSGDATWRPAPRLRRASRTS